MVDPVEPDHSSTADRPRRARRERIDPKTVLAAAQAVENLSEQSLAAVASSKGMTVLELRVGLLVKLHELAMSGDLQATEALRERTAGAVLGPIDRVRSARRLARRVEKALGRGLISISEASKLVQLVRIRRELELELDDLSERVQQVEGAVLERSG